MILFVVAFYEEAKPIIDFFELKRLSDEKKVQIFQKEEIALVISGIGKLNSAISTTYFIQKFPLERIAKIINVGICGTNNKSYEKGAGFLIHKVMDYSSKKSFYPDLTHQYGVLDETLVTFDTVQIEDLKIQTSYLVDMEGFGFFQAATYFLPSSKVQIFKVISDYLFAVKFQRGFVEKLIFNSLPIIEKLCFYDKKKEVFTLEEKKWISHTYDFFQLTEFQKKELLNLLTGYKLKHEKDIRQLSIDFLIKSKHKHENKRKYEKLKQYLIS